MISQGLVDAGAPLMAEVETGVTWNRDGPKRQALEGVFEQLNIAAMCFSRPAEPYNSMISWLASGTDLIQPEDNETRLFLHDLPVVHEFDAAVVAKALGRRKAAIIEGHGVVTCGTVTMEQCFVVFSSVLFSCFVKFFADLLQGAGKGRTSKAAIAAFEKVMHHLAPAQKIDVSLETGPFLSEAQVYGAIAEAGRPIVRNGLVDSVMGNISYRFGDTLYISQTGSFLDELEGCIDPCPLDNSACTGITASTELPAHSRIVTETPWRAVLHGHPKFAVIMSLACEKTGCEFEGQCHTKCPEERHVAGAPILPGESGVGPHALCQRVPEALKTRQGVIVYGHGVFTAAAKDFNRPFRELVDIETRSRELYFERLGNCGIRV